MTTTRRDDRHPAGAGRAGFDRLTDPGANNFDAIRFALASLVVFSHSYPLLQGNNSGEPLSRLTGCRMSFGDLAVDGFFLVSGFLITRSWLRGAGVGSYLRNRALRIYPGFVVAALAGALVFGPWLAATPTAYWSAFPVLKFARSLPALQAIGPPVFGHLPYPAVNGSLWTVCYEFQCYLAVIVLGLLGFWRGRAWPAFGFALATCVYLAQTGVGFLGDNPWPRFSSCFLAGAWFHSERERLPRSSFVFAGSLAGLAVLARLPSWNGYAPAFFPLLGGYALFYLASAPAPCLHAWARRGDLSYGLYLFAFPVQQTFVRYAGPDRLTPLTLFLAAYPVALLLALASWRFVESPGLRRKSRPNRAPRPPVASSCCGSLVGWAPPTDRSPCG